MKATATTRLQAPAHNRGLSIPGLWWTPARVAYHNKEWRTVSYPKYTIKCLNTLSIAVSPIGTDGLCHFVAWDVDTGNPEDVEAILRVLPQGCQPFISASGRKGWHIWLFPDEPLPVKTAVRFVKTIGQIANVTCEVFPASQRSRCLKWPGSVHPETGLREVFVSLDDLDDTDRLDTPAILELLAEGCYRTPAEVVEAFVRELPENSRKTAVVIDSNLPSSDHHHWLEVFKDEQAGFKLLSLFGRHVKVCKLGQAFRCPVHPERRPSATFVRDAKGRIAFHDWHASKHGLESEFFTLPELYAALKTGELRKLDRREQAAFAKELAFILGYRNETTAQTLKLLLHSSEILLSLGRLKTKIFKILVVKASPKDWLKALSLKGLGDFEKVWVVCIERFINHAMDAKTEVPISKRWLAEKAGVKPEVANRALNLLCTLGILEKAKVVKHGGKLGADRFRLCKADEAEAKRRWEVLGKPDLRSFNFYLVQERLGRELATEVFRRTKSGGERVLWPIDSEPAEDWKEWLRQERRKYGVPLSVTFCVNGKRWTILRRMKGLRSKKFRVFGRRRRLLVSFFHGVPKRKTARKRA